MKNFKVEELEKFIRDNKDKFDIYEPESDHSQHFLKKLINKFKEVINIVPYLVKVGLATLLIFIVSFLIWRTYICPPLTRISLNHWKVEHDYRHQIHRNTQLAYKYINDSDEMAKFKSELQKFDDSYELLRKQLKENPSADNIANMLKFYQEELLTLEENIQSYTNKNTQSN
jgi:flagellar biosynthesis/type III secretory pathway M-ring protein FliF/YscJ